MSGSARPHLILIGSSTRAAAFSALRAGFQPVCLDQFCDADLKAHAFCQPLPDSLTSLRSLLAKWPDLPVMYTGGLENRIDWIEEIGATHPLWGNDVQAIQRVRDPEQLREAARLARLNVPEWQSSDAPPPTDGTWILRPLQGAGGQGICIWNDAARTSPTLQQPHGFQQFISGISHSALFIGPQEAGDVRFIGMTRQLVGEAVCHAGPFQWCGNIGPVALPVNVENTVRRFGNILKWKLGLRGLFGVDLVIDEQGNPWVTEVNPRYPASTELLEHATGIPFLREHARCFTKEELPFCDWNRAHPGEFIGKAILYAAEDRQICQPLLEPARITVDEVPVLTDLPDVGTFLRRGEPACSVFAESTTAGGTWELLQQNLQTVALRLHSVSTPVIA